MKRNARAKLILETHKITIFRSRNRIETAWCDVCKSAVRLINPEEAARLMGVSARTIYRQIENGELHFIEGNNNSVFICLTSLTQKHK